MFKFSILHYIFTSFLKSVVMFAQNVEFASDDTILESLFLHVAPDFGEHGSGIINNNFLFSMFKELDNSQGTPGKRFKVIDGGLEFVNGVMKAKNSNFKWQSHTADMSAQLQDPSVRLRFDIMTYTGSVVINKKHKAMVKGRPMIKSFIDTLRSQAMDTIPNDFNSAFWNTSPGSTEPTSVPQIISTTPTTGTLGGLSRSGNQYMQNGHYSTSVADIGSEAGISAMKRQIIQRAIGSGGKDRVDIVIMDDNLFSGLVGYLTTQNRFRPNERMAKLDFETIQMGTTTISYENTSVSSSENTITSGYIYGINSNHMTFKVLKDGNFKWEDQFERVGQSLNSALYFYVFCNLTTNLPKAHFVMSNVSTT